MAIAQPTQEDDDAAERAELERERARHDARVGLVVAGRYKILRTLGAGGMGAVYEAEHEAIGRKVALKCLHAEYARDPDVVTRFRREARAATAIGNEHIIDVTDVGELPDGAPFIVMELLAGQSLANAIERDGPFSIRRAVHLARQICDALAAAHDKGIVHRDLKPDNVFLTKRGGDPDFVKVLDFGISKTHAKEGGSELTRTGMALGTPSYMSPEQAQGLRDVDGRSDVWSLGVILYEMLAGTRPFVADTYPMLLMQIVGGEPTPVGARRRDVPPSFDALVMRCLEKPVGARVASMRELDEALAAFAQLDSSPELVAAPAGPISSAELAYARTAEQPSDPRVSADPRVSSGVRATAAAASPAASSSPAVTPAPARGLLVPALSVAALGAAVLVAVALWPATPEPEAPAPVAIAAPAPPPALDTTPVTEAPPAIEVAAPVTRRIESTPAGATVERDGTVIGTTPMDLELPDGAPVEITLRLAGRRNVTQTIEAGETPISISLEPARRAGPRLPELAPH